MSLFSRRHYNKIAAKIKQDNFQGEESVRKYTVELLSQMFEKDNERFDPERFAEAAGVEASS